MDEAKRRFVNLEGGGSLLLEAWKPLPSNSCEDMTMYTSVCMLIGNCKI